MGILEEALVAYTYVGVWISLSAGVILYNKYVLTVFGFPFPVALTMIHMAFCSSLARTSFCVWGCLNSLLTPHTRCLSVPGIRACARLVCARLLSMFACFLCCTLSPREAQLPADVPTHKTRAVT